MVDFILAALPWVVIGISLVVAIGAFRFVRRAYKNEQKEAKGNSDTYMSEGMSLGMCFGTAIGSSLMGLYGPMLLTYGICFGMLIGMVIGMNIKKSK